VRSVSLPRSVVKITIVGSNREKSRRSESRNARWRHATGTRRVRLRIRRPFYGSPSVRVCSRNRGGSSAVTRCHLASRGVGTNPENTWALLVSSCALLLAAHNGRIGRSERTHCVHRPKRERGRKRRFHVSRFAIRRIRLAVVAASLDRRKLGDSPADAALWDVFLPNLQASSLYSPTAD